MKSRVLFFFLIGLMGLTGCQKVDFSKSGTDSVETSSLTSEGESPFIEPVDSICEESSQKEVVYPVFVPLVKPSLAENCRTGFELNNLHENSISISSTAGSRAVRLFIDIATYYAPDEIKLVAKDKSGHETVLLLTCRMRTWDQVDPIKPEVVARPPDVTIRQFQVDLPAGTVDLTLDHSKVASPNYVRILGLCDFNLNTIASQYARSRLLSM